MVMPTQVPIDYVILMDIIWGVNSLEFTYFENNGSKFNDLRNVPTIIYIASYNISNLL